MAGGDAEKRAEGGMPCATAVEAEDELVEVGLEMAAAQAVVDAQCPDLEVGEDAMHPGQHDMGGHLADDMGIVADAGGAGISGPSVGLGGRPRCEILGNKGMQAVGRVVGHLGSQHPGTTGRRHRPARTRPRDRARPRGRGRPRAAAPRCRHSSPLLQGRTMRRPPDCRRCRAPQRLPATSPSHSSSVGLSANRRTSSSMTTVSPAPYSPASATVPPAGSGHITSITLMPVSISLGLPPTAGP